MTLGAGTRIGSYEIMNVLGTGGMGEVYRARDLRLNRFVALKVLPGSSSLDPECRERLEREAQMVAALNHPNVVTLFSVETSGDALFLTMELVEGRPLSNAIPNHGVPIHRLLDIAIPVADAVAAAHQKGITHRDLKPANIMLGEGEHAGRIKVLDFGLAKLAALSPGAAGTSGLATALETAEGRVLGTVAYMSPEQAQGKSLDARSDLFSLGVILYEMATGCRPFSGDTSISIISSIVKDTPMSITEVNPSLPRELSRIIRRALSKDPEHRYQTAKDLRNDLEDLKSALTSGELESPSSAIRSPGGRSSARSWLWTAIGATAVVAAIIAVLLSGRRPPADRTSATHAIRMLRLTSTGNAHLPAISPDGKYVAYIQGDTGQQSLWVHQIAGSSDARIVAPTPGVSILALTVTPDGAFVDFVRQARPGVLELWRVPFLGGAPRKLVDDAWSAPSWSPDGKRMAYMVRLSEVAVAEADGSHPRVIARRKGPDRYLSLGYLLPQDFRPVWLPDGHSLVVIGNDDARGYTALQLVTINVETGTEHILQLPESRDLQNGMGMALAPDRRSFILSHVLEGGPPQVVRFDPSSGQMARLTNDVNEYAGISLAGDAVVTAQRSIQSSLWMANAAGNNARQLDRDVPAEIATRGTLQWGGPSRLVYYAALAGGTGLWSLDLASNTAQLIVSEGKTPSVSADGRTLVFMRGSGTVRLWRADVDGRNAAEVPGALGFTPSITPDGSEVFYVSLESGDQRAWKVNLGEGRAHMFAPMYVFPFGVAVSPDGRQVALLSRDQGQVIVILPANGGEAVRRLRTAGVEQIRWTPDGRALAYVQADAPSNIWVQSIDGGPARQLTSFTDRRIVAYAWSPDGKQLAISRAIDTSDVVLLKGVE